MKHLLTAALTASVLWIGTHPPQDPKPLMRAWINGETTVVHPDGRLERFGAALAPLEVEGSSQWPVAGYLVLPGYGVVEVGAGGLDELSWLAALPPNRVEDVESLHYTTVEEWEAAGAPGAR